MPDKPARKRKLRLAKYGYGIVTQDGEMWSSECCVCEDRLPLDDQVADENMDRADVDRLRVVALYFKTIR